MDAPDQPEALEAFPSPAGAAEEHIGPYRVVRRLDINETSETVLAVSQGPHGFERCVAIKRLLPHAADANAQRSLGREATAYARLTHPAIVRLYDFFSANDLPAMVLEYVDGVPLERLIAALRQRREKLPMPSALHVGARVFAALAAAHAARDPLTREFSPVIHRDVTPTNVLVTIDGDVKLTNFAFAKLVGKKTETGLALAQGACEYMAPEQLMGEPVTVRTDVYAAALIVRELLCGAPAFTHKDGEPYVEFLQRVAQPKLGPIDEACPTAPRDLVDALHRALEVDAERRAVTAADLARMLGRYRDEGRADLAAAVARLDPVARDDEGSGDRLTDCPSDSKTVVSFRRPPLVTEPTVLVDLATTVEAPLPGTTADSTPGLACEALAEEGEGRRSASTVPPVSKPRRGLGRLASILIGAGLLGTCVVVATTQPLVGRVLSKGAHAAPASALGAPAMAAPAAVASPTIGDGNAAANAPAGGGAAAANAPSGEPDPTPTQGELRTPASTHRLFVDGRNVGDSGVSITLPCGPHVVRIGATGRAQTVDVPCGGVVDLAAKR